MFCMVESSIRTVVSCSDLSANVVMNPFYNNCSCYSLLRWTPNYYPVSLSRFRRASGSSSTSSSFVEVGPSAEAVRLVREPRDDCERDE